MDAGRVGVQADRSARVDGVQRAANLVQHGQERLAALPGQGAVDRPVMADQGRYGDDLVHRRHGPIITRPPNEKTSRHFVRVSLALKSPVP